LNKLAVLAFALLLFFSTMLWYLANGSLNDYLKSQVVLQSQYYSAQEATLLNADFSNNTGVAQFIGFSLSNINGLTQPSLFKADEISAQLAAVPSHQLNSPSIQKKTTTVVHVKELRLGRLHAWSEQTKSGETGKTNLEEVFNQVSTKLAMDYPALYPQISAELYAEMYPERSEKLALEDSDNNLEVQKIETNKAVIASNEAKQKKRLLGKALTRVTIKSVIIDELILTIIKDNKVVRKNVKNIQLGSFGDENGLDSNQLGGELLKQVLYKLISIEKSTVIKRQINAPHIES
jgi:hypothetical protein